MSDVHVVIHHVLEDQTIRVMITIPFHEYGQSLFPNQYLKDKINEAVEQIMDEARNRR